MAHALIAKYAWHLPLYRQAQMLLAQVLDIKRSILRFGWAMRRPSSSRSMCGCASPFWPRARSRSTRRWRRRWIPAAPHQERLLLDHRSDDRPWGGADPPAIAYNYAPVAGRCMR